MLPWPEWQNREQSGSTQNRVLYLDGWRLLSNRHFLPLIGQSHMFTANQRRWSLTSSPNCTKLTKHKWVSCHRVTKLSCDGWFTLQNCLHLFICFAFVFHGKFSLTSCKTVSRALELQNFKIKTTRNCWISGSRFRHVSKTCYADLWSTWPSKVDGLICICGKGVFCVEEIVYDLCNCVRSYNYRQHNSIDVLSNLNLTFSERNAIG